MAMNAKQFDLYMKVKHQELTEAWKAIPPTESEVMTKAIIDYQYKATTAVLDAINNMNTANHDRWAQLMVKIERIEKKLSE